MSAEVWIGEGVVIIQPGGIIRREEEAWDASFLLPRVQELFLRAHPVGIKIPGIFATLDLHNNMLWAPPCVRAMPKLFCHDEQLNRSWWQRPEKMSQRLSPSAAVRQPPCSQSAGGSSRAQMS